MCQSHSNKSSQLTYMASEQTNNTNDFLNELSFEKPDHIKLEIEKNMIKKRRRVLKKSAEALEDRIRRLVAEHRAVKMKITLADGQLRYIQEQMDSPKVIPMQTNQPPLSVPIQTKQSDNATTLMDRITNINVNHLACFIIYNIKIIYCLEPACWSFRWVLNSNNFLLKRSKLTISKL